MFEILNGLAFKLISVSKSLWTPLLYALIVPAFQQLPEPSGPYAIGSFASQHTDLSRTNMPFDEQSRTLMVHWWFPIHDPAKSSKPATYMSTNVQLFEGMLAKEFHMSKKFVHDLLQVNTHSYKSPPPQDYNKPLPVILISHGLGGFGESQTYIAENLASRGYIVAGIDHTNFSTVSTFPDGTVVWHNAQLTSPAYKTTDDLLAFYASMFTIPEQDIIFVLNELARMNADTQSVWHQKLDLNNIGLIGHSMGGMAGTEAARNDSRIKALVNLDGWLPGFNSTASLNIPLLFLRADKSKNNLMLGTDIFENFTAKQLNKLYDQTTNEINQFCKNNRYAQVLVARGASHLAFCDFLLIKWPFTEWVPSRTASWLRQENPYPIIREVNTNIRTFFDRYLGN